MCFWECHILFPSCYFLLVLAGQGGDRASSEATSARFPSCCWSGLVTPTPPEGTVVASWIVPSPPAGDSDDTGSLMLSSLQGSAISSLKSTSINSSWTNRRENSRNEYSAKMRQISEYRQRSSKMPGWLCFILKEGIGRKEGSLINSIAAHHVAFYIFIQLHGK